jgi:hypothetical protein
MSAVCQHWLSAFTGELGDQARASAGEAVHGQCPADGRHPIGEARQNQEDDHPGDQPTASRYLGRIEEPLDRACRQLRFRHEPSRGRFLYQVREVGLRVRRDQDDRRTVRVHLGQPPG